MGKIFVERERSGDRLYGQKTREKGKVVVLIIYYIGIGGRKQQLFALFGLGKVTTHHECYEPMSIIPVSRIVSITNHGFISQAIPKELQGCNSFDPNRPFNPTLSL